MKKRGVLHGELAKIIADLGHGNTVCICDAGLPIPPGVKRVDLVVTRNVPRFFHVVDAVIEEMEIEFVTAAQETKERSPQIWEHMVSRFSTDAIRLVSHEEFKAMTDRCAVVIRTGEFTPYANVIFHAGVVF